MSRIVTFFIERSFVVNIISALLIIVGGISAYNMKRDLIPQFRFKQVQIFARLKGASNTQIEKLVTFPIEESIQNIAGIDFIESRTTQGKTTIDVFINDDYQEVMELVQTIQSRINSIRSNLPEEIDEISVQRIENNSQWFGSMAVVNFKEANSTHQLWLNEFIEKLRKINGIIRIDDNVRRNRLYIDFFPEKLARYYLTPEEVEKNIRENFNIYSIGTLDKGSHKVILDLTNSNQSLKSIGNIIVKGNSSGQTIRLKDIAKVHLSISKRRQKNLIEDKDAAFLWLQKDFESDTIDLLSRFNSFLVKEQKSAPKGLKLITTGNSAKFISSQLDVLKSNGLTGLILVLFSLFLFLGIKTSFWTAFGLPLSYLGTFILLSHYGYKIDLITLIAMILILGILVDDAIIVAEQYTQFLEKGFAPKEAAKKAVMTTIIPVTGTIITTIVAFLPLLMSNSSIGQILMAIPVVVITALFLSWIESFFILPNHLHHFVKKAEKNSNNHFFKKLQNTYEKTLSFFIKFRHVFIFSFILLMIKTGSYFEKNVSFKSHLRFGNLKHRISIALKESQSINETQKKLLPLINNLKNIDKKHYSHMTTRLGRTFVNHHSVRDYRYADITFRYDETKENVKESRSIVRKKIIEVLKPYKSNPNYDFLNFQEKIEGSDEEVDKTISIKIKGSDKLDYKEVLEKVKSLTKNINGLETILIDPNLEQEFWKFEINHDHLKKYGITPNFVANQLRLTAASNSLAEIRHRGQNIKIYTRFNGIDEEKLELKDLSEMYIIIDKGRRVKLKNLGTWKKSSGIQDIKHVDLRREFAIEATFNDEKIKKEQFIKELSLKIQPLRNELSSFDFIVEDADREAKKNKQNISTMLMTCLGLIFLVLALVLGSITGPFIIMLSIPFGLIGVIWAFAFHNMDIDIMAMVGIIGMIGVVVNDSLIMVSFINQLDKNSDKPTRQNIVNGASSRLRAIILTSITTLGGVFPLAYGLSGESGFTRPLAMSLGWGLLFATILTLFLLPCLLEVRRETLHFFGKIYRKIFKRENSRKNPAEIIPTPLSVDDREKPLPNVPEEVLINKRKNDERPTIQ